MPKNQPFIFKICNTCKELKIASTKNFTRDKGKKYGVSVISIFSVFLLQEKKAHKQITNKNEYFFIEFTLFKISVKKRSIHTFFTYCICTILAEPDASVKVF